MSYGTNSPKGLVPSQYMTGTAWTGQTSPYLIASGYATSIFTNDPVSRLADGTIGIGIIGGAIIGSFQGCVYRDTTGTLVNSPYWPANTVTFNAGYVTAYVVDDQNILYDMQVATGGGGGPVAAPAITQDMMNSNANFAIAAQTYNPIGGVTPAANTGAGNTISGLSGYYIDSTTIANANPTRNITLVRFTPVPGNVSGLIFNNALVRINNNSFSGGTGTAGV